MKNKIPWSKLGIESLVIIVSILLALAGDAWWQTRQENRDERELLLDLRLDLEENKGRIQDKIDQIQSVREDIAAFLRLTASEASSITGDRHQKIVQPIILSFTLGGMNYTLIDSIIDSGDLSLIHSARLRAAIVEFETIKEIINRIHENIGELTYAGVLELANQRDALRGYWDLGSDQTTALSDDTLVEEIRANTRIEAILVAKTQRYSGLNENQERLLGHVDQVLNLVDSELERP